MTHMPRGTWDNWRKMADTPSTSRTSRWDLGASGLWSRRPSFRIKIISRTLGHYQDSSWRLCPINRTKSLIKAITPHHRRTTLLKSLWGITQGILGWGQVGRSRISGFKAEMEVAECTWKISRRWPLRSTLPGKFPSGTSNLNQGCKCVHNLRLLNMGQAPNWWTFKLISKLQSSYMSKSKRFGIKTPAVKTMLPSH